LMMQIRAFVAGLILLVGIFATHNLKAKESAGLRRPLNQFPSKIGDLQSEDRPYQDEVVKAIGADEYLNRAYLGTRPIELFIGYYKDQRSSEKMHSPRNCLPGAGWEPIRSTSVQIASAAGIPVVVNGYVVAQGAERDMVLYWYQGHGRVVASEYGAKFWLVADALRGKSADGAMIRIWTTAADGEANAQARAAAFASSIYSKINEFLPD
jgi:EpsI family protein